MMKKIADFITAIPVFIMWIRLMQKQLKTDREQAEKHIGMITAFCISLCAVSALFTVILQKITGPGMQEDIKNIFRYNMCNLLIYLLFIADKIRVMGKNSKKAMIFTILTSIMMMGQVVLYYKLYFTGEHKVTGELISIMNVCSMMLLFAHGVILSLTQTMIEKQKIQNETANRMMEQKYEHDYYLLGKEQKENIRTIRDEMKMRLKSVQDEMDHWDTAKDQARDMLIQMEKRIGELRSCYYCKDSVLNTVLILKQEAAAKQGISMDIRVEEKMDVEMEDIDLCCLVTNLLDNAIEASVKVEEDQRKIRVRAGQRGAYQLFQVENPAVKLPEKNKKGRFTSSKKDEDPYRKHGRGIGIIEKTVEKYDGFLDFDLKDHQVKITAFIKKKNK